MTANGVRVPLQGVVTVAPKSVHQSIKSQVDAALQGVKAGKTMAILNVTTESGVNLAIAHRINEHFEVVSWIGKSGWQQPIAGGVSIAYSR